jgi:hypothetical protein
MLDDALVEFAGRARLPVLPDYIGHAYYKYYFFLPADALRREWSRDIVMQAIEAEGVPCFSGSCSEIYLERAFEMPGMRPSRALNCARTLAGESIMLQVHPTLDDEQIRDVANAVTKVLRVALNPSA